MPSEDRLTGLWLVLAGLGMLLVLRLLSQPGLIPQPTPPPGFPSGIPIVSPLSCLAPILALGAVGMILVGLKRLLFP